MNCIIVNEDITAKEAIQMLINQTENLVWIGSFNDILEVSKFMSENAVDLVFFDFQTDETDSIEFIKTIPNNVFVIFISELSSFVIKNHKFDVIEYLSERFQKGVDEAHIYFKLLKKSKSNNIDDYFVI